MTTITIITIITFIESHLSILLCHSSHFTRNRVLLIRLLIRRLVMENHLRIHIKRHMVGMPERVVSGAVALLLPQLWSAGGGASTAGDGLCISISTRIIYYYYYYYVYVYMFKRG